MSQPDDTRNSSSEQDSAKSRRGSLLGFFLLLLLIITGIGAFAGWKFWQEFESAILASSADTGSLKAAQRKLENEIQILQSTFATRQQLEDAISANAREAMQLSDRVVQLEQDLDELRQSAGGDNSSMVRAEARYLVQIANDELLLRGNVNNAMQALQMADARLRDAGGTAFGNVRASIARDLVALKSLPDPDVTGMALTLASLANAVESFTLGSVADTPAETGEVVPEGASMWERFKAATGRLFRSVVTVRNVENPRPFLTPGQEYFLLRNLELKLESTRLSLLTGDTENFKVGADVSLHWLELYFDPNDPAVSAASEQLELMRNTELPSGFPDLSTTMRLLDAEG